MNNTQFKEQIKKIKEIINNDSELVMALNDSTFFANMVYLVDHMFNEDLKKDLRDALNKVAEKYDFW